MKATLTIFCILLAGMSFSCSLAYKSFCETASIRQGDKVMQGVITDTIMHGIRLKVINTIRGTEMRDTITIWDGTDIECNGPFPQNASQMGNIGDTVLTVISQVISVEELWQVFDDYVYPNNFGFTPHLRITGDTLRGFISGNQMAPQEYTIWNMRYSYWLYYWYLHGNSCIELVGIKEEEEFSIILLPNPAQSTLYLQNSSSPLPVRIFTAEGALIANTSFVNGKLDISSFANGIYYAEMTLGNKTRVKKFVKTE